MMPALNARSSKLLPRIAILTLALIAPTWAQRAAADDRATPPPELPTGQQLVGPDIVIDHVLTGLCTRIRVDEVRFGGLQIEAGGRAALLRELPAEPAVPLPPDAQKVFDQYQQEQNAARQKYEQQHAQATDAVVKQLEAMQLEYVKAGKLEDALAVRNQIQFLQARAAEANAVAQADKTPNIAAFRGHAGKTLTFEVTGSINGPLWGSGVYTDDSSPAVAAVHAGIVQPGQKAMVRVTVQDGLPAFQGSTANGVTSQAFGPWEGAYKIERAPAGAAQPAVPALPAQPVNLPGNPPVFDLTPTNPPATHVAPADNKTLVPPPGANPAPAPAAKPLADPGNLRCCREFIGQSFDFEVTGSIEGRIWGVGIYTEDSPLATAAVHAGALQPGEKGIVHVAILRPAEKYAGSAQNGVTSLAYGQVGECAYQIDVPQNHITPAGLRQQALQRATVSQLRDLIPGPHPEGSSFDVEILGGTEGTVWGDGVYTDDSNLAAAAVHAGVIGEGERGKVKVTLLPGQENYTGGNKNGVTTQNYGRWAGSFKVERAARDKPAGEAIAPRAAP